MGLLPNDRNRKFPRNSRKQPPMIYEFTAGYNYWYIDTDRKYVKITDKNDGTVIKETDQLSLLIQIKEDRIAAYDDTPYPISISAPIVDNHFFLEDLSHRPDPYFSVIWEEDYRGINLFFKDFTQLVRAYPSPRID